MARRVSSFPHASAQSDALLVAPSLDLALVWHAFVVQFLRTMSSYSRWMPAIVGFVKSCKWTQLSLLYLRSVTFESTVAELSHEFFLSKPKLSVIASINFDEDSDDASMSTKMQAIVDRRSSKVVVAMALESTYWKIALAAKARGMVSGWAWIGLDAMDGSGGYAPIDQMADAKLAFNGWVYFEPHVAAGREFFDRVHNATRSDFPRLFDENVLPTRYAASMYDAITLFATVANAQSWHPDQGGRAFLNQSIGNTSFVGTTGLVKLDLNGDLRLSYQVLNLVVKNGAVARIAVGMFSAGTQSYSSVIAIIWPGGKDAVPADTTVSDNFDTKWVLVGAGVSAVVVVGGLVIVVRYGNKHLQAIMVLLFTEVSSCACRAVPCVPCLRASTHTWHMPCVT